MRNQQGSVLLNSIIMTLVIASVSGVMLQQANTTEKTLRAPRIRAAMVAIEGALRYRLMQPSSYAGCTSTGTATCTFDTAAIADLIDIIPGCDDEGTAEAPCGVRLVQVPATPWFNSATRTFRGNIVYEGTEIRISPNDVTVIVPLETLQAVQYTCPVSQPFFQGYDPTTGAAICKALTRCPAGSFVKGIDPVTFEPLCQTLDSSAIDCSGGPRMVQSITFGTLNSGRFDYNCVVRDPPTTVFGL